MNSFGANLVEQFSKIKAIGMGYAFREQAKKWLHQRTTRKHKPVKPVTVRGWESYLTISIRASGILVLPHIDTQH